MEVHYSRLQIELTRLCNQICKHCCHGKAQDISLSKEIIDSFFDNNDIKVIETLLFSGGEPMLNGKAMIYLVDKLIKLKINIGMFTLCINGLIYDEDLIIGLNNLYDYIVLTSDYERLCPGILMITQDQFHEDADPKVVSQLEKLPYFSPVMKTTLREEDILPYGYAYENNLTTNKPDLKDLIDYQKNYEVITEDEKTYLYIEYQYIAANGNIINDGCYTYELMDKYALGNVKNNKIQDIYLSPEEKRLYLNK